MRDNRGSDQGRRRVLLVSLAVLMQGAAAFGDESQDRNPAVAAAPGEAEGDTLADLFRDQSPAQPPSERRSTTGAFLRVIGWTIAIVALGGAVLLVIRKYTPAGRMLAGGGIVHVLARTSLSPRHTVFVVRIARHRVLVVGISGDRMTTLSEISDPAQIVEVDSQFRSRLDSFAAPGAGDEDRRESATAGAPEREGETARAVDLEPYRREVEKLRTVIGGWRNLMTRAYQPGPERSRELEDAKS